VGCLILFAFAKMLGCGDASVARARCKKKKQW